MTSCALEPFRLINAISIHWWSDSQYCFHALRGSDAIFVSKMGFFFSLNSYDFKFSDIDWMKENSRFSGTIILIAYDIGIWSHFIISINRMCAIFFPLTYNCIFRQFNPIWNDLKLDHLSIRNTKIAICILWIGTIVPAYYFYTWTSPECNIFFKFDFYRYTFTQNDLCFAIIMYFDLMKYYFFLKSHDWSNRPHIPGILLSW